MDSDLHHIKLYWTSDPDEINCYVTSRIISLGDII